MRLDQIFGEALGDTRPDSGDRRRQRARSLMSTVGSGLKAVINLATTMAGSPSAELREPDMGAVGRKLQRPEVAPALAEARARSEASLGRLRAEREERLSRAREEAVREQIHEQTRRADRQDAESETRRREAESRVRLNEARTRAQNVAADNPARNSGNRKSGGTSRKSTISWTDPSTGERYDVDRGEWDKSSHTLFDIVVETSRPEPDQRGYPSDEEWYRHCRDTYGHTRDSRDAYIIHNLPGNARALEYLKRIRRR
ncbi:MAG: hypothetical protein NC336_06585 [Clostridium sp.]|nr:hypothetical protein [Clostridium sp.]